MASWVGPNRSPRGSSGWASIVVATAAYALAGSVPRANEQVRLVHHAKKAASPASNPLACCTTRSWIGSDGSTAPSSTIVRTWCGNAVA